ncbi:thioredoxin domain-containing protein [Shewanella sp. A32]|uniref:DsbA family protein n=1 Tax=Shewanella sp. A32 TaxID=3031327 RepID=UPI0023B97788|nr:thioredoxin domain-containing protein [Shewanella sp. A32]MDF0534286.1 thioredoxin domain-containing protein [Shewanella sp. A32]
MYKYGSVISLLLTCAALVACQPKPSDDQQQLQMLRQDVKNLQIQLKQVAKQVDEIHQIATDSTRPKTKTLPTLKDLDLGGTLPSLGSKDAKVAILEFSDFQCPYCKRFMDTSFSKLKSEFIDNGKVLYVVRNYPLSFHSKAEGAAIAAECAKAQQQYWPMRELLFANAKTLGDELYTSTAEQLKLNMDTFKNCLADPAIKTQVAADLAYGQQLGINGTPSFVIGKVKDNQLIEPELLVGAQPIEAFLPLISKKLAD